MADKSRSEKKSSNPAAKEAAEKHIFATSGVKTPHSFEGGYRSAGSAAPPKIGVFPQPVKPCPPTTEPERTLIGASLGHFQGCCGAHETAGPSTPLLIPFGNEKLRSG